jgi:hypothetical protein
MDGTSELCLYDDDSFEAMIEKMMLMTIEERQETFDTANRILDALEVAEHQLRGATLH